MLIEDLQYYKRSANYTSNTSGMDHPDRSQRTTKEWHAYPVQDFDYKFNSWGFRGPDYKQYIDKKVNICLGDSFTVNVGGPIEHSWCSQLALHFDVPTINLGMDGAGNDAIRLVYDRACDLFDVQNTFVMYSYLHRRLKNNDFIHVGCLDHYENIKLFEKNMLQDAIYTFLPSWCWDHEELDYLQNRHKNNLYNLPYSKSLSKSLSSLSYKQFSKKTYNRWKGPDWVPYDEFTKGITNKTMQDDEIFISNIGKRWDSVNRDGLHLNQSANKIVADFLWSQYNAT